MLYVRFINSVGIGDPTEVATNRTTVHPQNMPTVVGASYTLEVALPCGRFRERFLKNVYLKINNNRRERFPPVDSR